MVDHLVVEDPLVVEVLLVEEVPLDGVAEAVADLLVVAEDAAALVEEEGEFFCSRPALLLCSPSL